MHESAGGLLTAHSYSTYSSEHFKLLGISLPFALSSFLIIPSFPYFLICMFFSTQILFFYSLHPLSLMRGRQTGHINHRLPTCHHLWQKSRLKTNMCWGWGYHPLSSFLFIIHQGFSILALLPFWIILCCGRCPLLCRIFSSNPDLYPLDASSTPPPKVIVKNVSRH